VIGRSLTSTLAFTIPYTLLAPCALFLTSRRRSKMLPPSARPTNPASYCQAFLHHHTKSVEQLQEDETVRPLCTEPYQPTVNYDDNPNTEYALHVNINNCHHVFGHRCLKTLIKLEEPWANRCPFCRAHWFHTDCNVRDTEDAQTIIHLPDFGRPWSALQREAAGLDWTRDFHDYYADHDGAWENSDVRDYENIPGRPETWNAMIHEMDKVHNNTVATPNTRESERHRRILPRLWHLLRMQPARK
jgi:hypothetical protein